MEKVSPLERILAVAGGLLLQDIVIAGIGAAFGVKEMMVNIMQQIALATVTILIVGFNPWILTPVLLSGGFIHGLIKINSTNDQVKKAFTQKYIDQLRQSSFERADETANAVTEKLLQLQNAVDKGLATEIQSLRDQVNSVLEEKQKGQDNVEQKLGELALILKELNVVDSELDGLIAQVAV